MLSTETKLRIAEYAILFASIILHEISHGWTALSLGDDTAKRAGRLSLNPLVHIDPFGSVILPALLIISGTGFLFGWAKPVPVNVARLRHPRNDAVLTSLAGPATNLVLVVLADAALHVFHPETFWPVALLLYAGLLNLLLACFNLLPIPPLDGSALVERLLPRKWWGPYLAIRPYTLILVFGLVIIGERSGVYDHALNGLATNWANAAGYPGFFGP
jgi:Zn-dependent protease